MKEKLFKLELPKKYKENLFEYKPMVDGYPQLIDKPVDFPKEKFNKLLKLINIESMKYILSESITANEVTFEEIEQTRKIIENQINEYNKM